MFSVFCFSPRLVRRKWRMKGVFFLRCQFMLSICVFPLSFLFFLWTEVWEEE